MDKSPSNRMGKIAIPSQFHSLLKSMNVDATKLGISFVEAKIGRLFLKPATVPARLWLSWKGATSWRNYTSSKHARNKDVILRVQEKSKEAGI